MTGTQVNKGEDIASKPNARGNDEGLGLESMGHFFFSDPDQMAQTIPGGQYGILPLPKKAFAGEFLALYLGNGMALRSARFRNGVNARIFLEQEKTISFFLPNVVGRQLILNGKPIDRGVVHLSAATAFHSARTGPAHEVGRITVELESMRRVLDIQLRGKHDFLRSETLLCTDPRHVSTLHALHRKSAALYESIHRQTSPNPRIWQQARVQLHDAILTELIAMLSSGRMEREHRSSRFQTASMARIERHIDEHAFSSLGLQELCMATELSLRTVERVIRSRTGFTALNYLKMRRLAFAREILLHPTDLTTVADAALTVGLLHFGRFSSAYRNMYGELPSETLRRSKA